MSTVGLVCSEPLRARQAGIGIRYAEIARRLPDYGFGVRLVAPVGDADQPEWLDEMPEGASFEVYDPGGLGRQLSGCDVVCAQGQLGNDVVLQVPDVPTVLDFYDPWLVENLHYYETLGLDPYRNDHETWLLQLSRGDFFLCSSEEQRLFYLGLLTALGRVNPELVARDPALESLVAVVPFGLPEQLPEPRLLLEERDSRVKRLLFGGLYDWYDPWTLLKALDHVDCDWRLLLIHQPGSGAPQRLFEEVQSFCSQKGWWGTRVETHDWVAFDRRFDLLRDVDVLVAPHRPSLETDLSLRTRFLDALAVGCPVVTSAGGALSRLLDQHDAGWVVPCEDELALARALNDVLSSERSGTSGRTENARRLAADYTWTRTLEPLISFLRDPSRDVTKVDYAHGLGTRSPDDPLDFRMRRRLKRLFGGAS